jgi:ketosteroid isomerase-like protein
MRKMMTYTVAMAMFVAAGAVSAEDGINEIGEAFVKAMKAGDLDAVAALYAPDAVSYPPDQMLAQGREAIRDSWGGLLNAFDVSEIVISNAHHETRGDFSTAWGQFKMVLVPKGGGEPVVMEGRFADAAELVDGEWQYVMDHASVPLPPPPKETQ